MKIGIDYRPALLGGTGIGRYVREITAAMTPLLAGEESLCLFGVSLAEGEGFHPLPSEKVVLVRKRFPGRLLDLLGRFGAMGVEDFTGRLDLFLYTDLVYPPLKRTPCCVVVYDLTFLESEKWHESGFGRSVWKRMRRKLEDAAAVIVPSRATVLALERRFPSCRDRVHMVPLGGDHLVRRYPAVAADSEIAAADSEIAAADSEIATGAPFFLSIGTLEPRKNHERLLRAFESIAPSFPDTRLVIGGKRGWLYRPFLKKLDDSHVRDRVRLLTDLDDRELAALYRSALALVYPSLCEGFGLPVAEALSFGCPVITSNRSSMPEITGSEAALLVDPEDPSALAGAMDRIARNGSLRKGLSCRGLKRAGMFTWEKTAAATLEIFRSLKKETLS